MVGWMDGVLQLTLNYSTVFITRVEPVFKCDLKYLFHRKIKFCCDDFNMLELKKYLKCIFLKKNVHRNNRKHQNKQIHFKQKLNCLEIISSKISCNCMSK